MKFILPPLEKGVLRINKYARYLDEFLPRQTVRNFGLILLVMGLIFTIIGGFCFFMTSKYNHGLGSITQIKRDACIAKIQTMGLQVEGDLHHVQIKMDNLQQGLQALTMTSAAAVACPGWHMESFCAGEACGTPPVQMTLTDLPLPFVKR